MATDCPSICFHDWQVCLPDNFIHVKILLHSMVLSAVMYIQQQLLQTLSKMYSIRKANSSYSLHILLFGSELARSQTYFPDVQLSTAWLLSKLTLGWRSSDKIRIFIVYYKEFIETFHCPLQFIFYILLLCFFLPFFPLFNGLFALCFLDLKLGNHWWFT